MRAQIVVDGSGLAFYLHDGGQPTHVVPVLQPLLRDFARHRGLWDHENLVVHVVFRFTQNHQRYWEDFIRGQEQIFGRAPTPEVKFCGLGLERFDGQFHGDLDYLYIVRRLPVECLEVRVPLRRRFGEDPVEAHTRLLRRMDPEGNNVTARPSRRRHKPRGTDELTRNLEF